MIYVKRLNDDAIIPKFQTEGSVGFDFHSIERIEVMPNRITIVPTGLSFEFSSKFALLILPRSGLASRGIGISNSPGLIDPDFRGEIKILMHTLIDKPFIIEKGDRIAQGLFVECFSQMPFTEIGELSETKRGTAGFGSTGV